MARGVLQQPQLIRSFGVEYSLSGWPLSQFAEEVLDEDRTERVANASTTDVDSAEDEPPGNGSAAAAHASHRVNLQALHPCMDSPATRFWEHALHLTHTHISVSQIRAGKAAMTAN